MLAIRYNYEPPDTTVKRTRTVQARENFIPTVKITNLLLSPIWPVRPGFESIAC